MSGVVCESEPGYDAEDYLVLPSLTDIPGAVVAGPGEQVLEAMYFDTAYIDNAYIDNAYIDTATSTPLGWT